MTHVSRRSFLAASVAATATGSSLLDAAQAAEEIPGLDRTKTDYDRTKQWKPFSDRKVRVGIVGHGVCQFGLAFDLQNHPNVELVAVSDLFPDRCADMARKAKCEKTYPSLEEMVKDDSIEAIYCATDAPAHAKHAILCMEHGKHVATAVPAFRGDIDDAEKLLECCRKNGSHGYLGDDFIDAILRGRKPAVDVIDALNMTVPGYYAHLSSTKDGETMKIPQYSL